MDVNEVISSTAIKTISLTPEEVRQALEAATREGKFSQLRDPALDVVEVNLYDDGRAVIIAKHHFADGASAG
jgi:hypothetical protein